MADEFNTLVNLRDAINDGRLGAFSGQDVEVYGYGDPEPGRNWFRMMIDGEPWLVSLEREAVSPWDIAEQEEIR